MQPFTPDDGPPRRANHYQITIGLHVPRANYGLHRRQKRDVLGAVGSVRDQTEQLPNADLYRSPLAHQRLEFIEIAGANLSPGIVLVNHPPAIAGPTRG